MDKKYIGSERRKFQRIKLPFFIFYRLKAKDPFATFRAISQNIGGAGLMFETEGPILREDILHLEIYQPSIKYKDLVFVLSVQAKVIWVKKKEDISIEEGEDRYQIGLKFLKIAKEDKDRVVKYVERIKKGW